MSQVKICPQCGEEYPLDVRFCARDGSTLKLQGGSTDLVGSIIADRYHVLRKLGEGGMGQVYLAEHVKMGRKSAVKVMNPGMGSDADAVSRFNREAANASRISHPNVAAVYDFGETSEGLIYLAMEYIDGPPLTKLIEQQGALAPRRAGEITRQAAEALAVAHDMGIVHRDLKPDNIMVARSRDGGDQVKVVDFGIAKAANNDAQKVTKTGLVVGTPEYMSPEQLAGDKLDGRSDIYSLALVAFNMLTGKLPFPAETVQESMIMRLTDRPRTLGEMYPGLAWPAEVQAVLDRALQRDVSQRYQSAAEFGRELSRAVQQMPAPSMADGATQVLGATQVIGAGAPAGAGAGATVSAEKLPSTRVGRSSSATAVVDAPVAGAKGASTSGRSPTTKRRIPIAAVAGLVVVVGAGAAFAMTRGGSPPKKAADSATVVPAGQPAGTSASAATTAPPVNLSYALDNIDPLVDPKSPRADSSSAARALASLDSLEAQVARADVEDFVRARYLKALAYYQEGDQTRMCEIVTSIEGKSVGTKRERAVKALLDPCRK